MSAPSEVFDQVEVPEIVELAGGKKSPRRRRSCPQGQRRSQTTGRCRRPCPQACKGEADDEDMLLDEIDFLQSRLNASNAGYDELQTQLGPSVMDMRRQQAVGTPYENAFGGGEMEGGASHRKRKLSTYNKFVMKYAAQHRGKTGKSLIRSAARAWREHKGGRSMSRSRSPSKRSHSHSRSRSRSMRR